MRSTRPKAPTTRSSADGGNPTRPIMLFPAEGVGTPVSLCAGGDRPGCAGFPRHGHTEGASGPFQARRDSEREPFKSALSGSTCGLVCGWGRRGSARRVRLRVGASGSGWVRQGRAWSDPVSDATASSRSPPGRSPLRDVCHVLLGGAASKEHVTASIDIRPASSRERTSSSTAGSIRSLSATGSSITGQPRYSGGAAAQPVIETLGV